jgi:uncharacterized protein YdhG (YjbR/CyaY superfamily)
MTRDIGERSSFFPAIENKYGQPIQFWLDSLAELADAKYPQQIALLREDHGFSQAHANAVVMFVRGSTTSKRFASPEAYLATLPEPHGTTTRAILNATLKLNSKFELVMAWNKPIVRLGTAYIIGFSAAKHHLLILPFGDGILDQTDEELLAPYKVNKKTIQVPADWKVDRALLKALVQRRLAQL